MATKECFKCKITWPIHYFYKHKQMKDGHLNKCKRCTKSDARKHRDENIEKIRKYDRDRFQNDEKRRAYAISSMAEHRKKHPDRYRARTALNNAVRDNKITKLPCCICGSISSTAHHEDYSKPLEVVWLCLVHHRQVE